MARRRAVLLDAGYPYLAAEREGVVLGYAYAGPYRPRAAYRSTVEDSIYVAREPAGRGSAGRSSGPWSTNARCSISGSWWR
jgi:phosphinothricin acetyltransferase